jgi:hypothetical protein
MKKPIRRIAVPKPASRTGTATAKATTSAKAKTSPVSSKKSASAGFDRGSAGFAKAKQKRERQEEDYQRKKDTPFGYWLKPGTEAEVIILDKGAPFFVSMHKVKGSNGKYVDEVCIADTGQHCPLCVSTGKEGSYTMVLSVLDRRPYTQRDGKVIKVSKKLAFVKGRNLPKFQRIYEGKANENLRGIKLTTRRDGEKESAMGEDIEFGGRVSEEFLAKFGEVGKAADYTKIFAMPTAAELKKRYGLTGGKVAGREEFAGDDDGDDYDSGDVGWGKE